MKKTIIYQLTSAEKQLLKTKRISQKLLQEYAPDEIAALLEASPPRARELYALAEFQSIPSLGINFANELISQGYYSLEQLKGKSAVALFNAFERHCGAYDMCCLLFTRVLFFPGKDHSADLYLWQNNFHQQYGCPGV